MQGVVQKTGKTQKGTPTVTIDGKGYFWGKGVETFPSVGSKIEFEYSEFGDDRGQGRPRSISRWAPVVDSSGAPQTASTVTDVDILRSVSNVVGNACAAGKVNAPEDLDTWFQAAWDGFTKKRMAKPASKQEEFDDEIPF